MIPAFHDYYLESKNHKMREPPVFPQIVFAETILFWKLECGNYTREETIVFLLFPTCQFKQPFFSFAIGLKPLGLFRQPI